MTQTSIFDRAASEFGRPFTLEELTAKLHEPGRGWEKPDSYITRCIKDRTEKRIKIRILENGLYEWIGDSTEQEGQLTEEQDQIQDYGQENDLCPCEDFDINLCSDYNAIDSTNNSIPKWKICTPIKMRFYRGLCVKRRIPGTVRTRPFSIRQIRNLSDITLAIDEIYRFGTPFSHKQTRPQITIACQYADLKAIFNDLAIRIYDYFNHTPNVRNNQKHFDEFHKSLCKQFLSALTPLCSKYSKDTPTYGNAQKLINVTFKYLSCYSDYNDFADLFSFCHIPIDSQILGAFRRYYRVPGVVSQQYRGTSWSLLLDSQYDNLVSAYTAALHGRIFNHPWLAVDFYYWGGMALPSRGIPVVRIAKFYI